MDYHILDTHGRKIASFEHEQDRDYCIDALRDAYPDCEFTAEGSEEQNEDENG